MTGTRILFVAAALIALESAGALVEQPPDQRCATLAACAMPDIREFFLPDEPEHPASAATAAVDVEAAEVARYLSWDTPGSGWDEAAWAPPEAIAASRDHVEIN